MTGQPTDGVLRASFRDPSGYVFRREGVLYRAVTNRYQANYDRLMNSGLYAALVKAGQLIPHEEVVLPNSGPDVYRVVKPEPVRFISYPYEWCFSQLKDAARLTLAVQQQALANGMSLKDASAYNVQFHEGRPVLIDTLSFEPYLEGEPWVAYRQFCQHFLAPLALMSHTDVRLAQLLRVYIDGVPLDLASKLLPGGTKLSLSLGPHIHLHARSQEQYADKAEKPKAGRMGKLAFQGLMSSLEGAVKGLHWKPAGTEWADYYDMTNYSGDAFQAKQNLVGEFLKPTRAEMVWDLGANTGVFSQVAAGQGRKVIAFDIDPAAVEKCYQDLREKGEKNILPLVMDFTNPSPNLGWQNRERDALLERGPAGAVLALALVHHLAIGNNVPLGQVADFLAACGPFLIIEFVPKSDSQVRKLLATREDIFPDYTPAGFEAAFSRRFETLDRKSIPGSERTLYLMTRRAAAT